MSEEKKMNNPLFDPISKNPVFPELIGTQQDQELFRDIFGVKRASRSPNEIDITLKRHYKKVRKQQK